MSEVLPAGFYTDVNMSPTRGFSSPVETSKTPEPDTSGSRIERFIDQPLIYILDPNPEEATRALGIDNCKVLFATALGLPPDSDRIRYFNVVDGDVPDSLEGVGGIIIGGSKFDAFGEYPNRDKLEDYVRTGIKREIPTFGVCFGHQIVYQAIGGTVERGSKGRELGVFEIELTDAGQKDPLFRGLPERFPQVQSHSDVASKLPERSDIVVLAQTELYDNQATALGDRVRTVQFHPEETRKAIESVIRARAQIIRDEGYVTSDQDIEDLIAHAWSMPTETYGRQIVHNFDRYYVRPYARGEL